jgi:threonine synthase
MSPAIARPPVSAAAGRWRGVIAEYAGRLPVPADCTPVTLGEGGTPLLHAPALSRQTGCEVFLKVEGANPTGSFKDRGMTVAVTLAAARGATMVICASTGNTSASAAAYAARAGLTCAVLVPQGKIAYVFARDGVSLLPAQTLASNAQADSFEDVRAFLGRGGQKGPQRRLLREGTHVLNLAQQTQLVEAFDEQRDEVTHGGTGDAGLQESFGLEKDSADGGTFPAQGQSI